MNEEDDKSRLGKLIKPLLKPLIRLLIRHDISHSELAEWARHVYVEEVYEHFTLPKRKMTYARASVLTGLSRKEVVRVRNSASDKSSQKTTKPNRAARVITGWMSDETFLDDNKKPKSLFLKEGEASFAKLVQRYSGDISVGAILDELLRLEIAAYQGDKIILLSQGYIPKNNNNKRIDILMRSTGNLLKTGLHNLQSSSEKTYLQRQLIHRDVSQNLAKEFQQYSKERANILLIELDQWLKEKGCTNEKNNINVGIGVYYYEENSHE